MALCQSRLEVEGQLHAIGMWRINSFRHFPVGKEKNSPRPLGAEGVRLAEASREESLIIAKQVSNEHEPDQEERADREDLGGGHLKIGSGKYHPTMAPVSIDTQTGAPRRPVTTPAPNRTAHKMPRFFQFIQFFPYAKIRCCPTYPHRLYGS